MIELIDIKNSELFNNGYQSPKRAESYSITQSYIVDKKPFFKVILERIVELRKKKGRRLHILELGCGPAFALQYIFEQRHDLIRAAWGCDLSKDMINIANKNLEKYQDKVQEIKLFYNVNLLNDNSDFYTEYLAENHFDIVISSQVDHYFPNAVGSELYNKLKDLKYLHIPTKNDYYVKIHEVLNKDGAFISIDDYDIDEKATQKWDEYVLDNLQNKDNIRNIKGRNPLLAKKISQMYSIEIDRQFLLKNIRQNRLKRREVCLEEISEINDVTKLFSKHFKNISVYDHPELDNFKLLIGFKQQCF